MCFGGVNDLFACLGFLPSISQFPGVACLMSVRAVPGGRQCSFPAG